MNAREALCGAALWLALANTTSAWAQTEPARPAGARPAVTSQTVEQKAAMIDQVLNHSAIGQRIQSGANAQAKKHLADARELYAHALSLRSTGQLRGADALLNEAIWEIGRAQQQAPDAGVRQAGERERYRQLQDSLQALMRSFEINVHVGAPAPRGQADAGNAALVSASKLAAADRHAEANRVLEQALAELLVDASQRLTGYTLVYDRKFDTPKDEYAYEVDRWSSYERLVPLALVEFQPGRDAQALVERYVAQGRAARERAQKQAAASDYANGVKSLLEGTDSLQRALQAAGLVVPQTMGSQ
jgi:hypothetical protein